jgi:bifunctional UDP-N-acetylglucosamine pyrophosphorylase/glucosamine-1-phosphate N-acetyltransferase/UDP-N-acetylglucosamine pyrophosphorylase
MVSQDIAFIILAAGIGKRMKSNKAKVLHEILGKPMIYYVLDTVCSISDKNIYVVVGHQSESVKISIENKYKVNFVTQECQLGTGHAVSCAIPLIDQKIKNIVILCGDTPLISNKSINELICTHNYCNNDLTVLAVEMDNPYGYGRILFSIDEQITGIVEEADATEEQRKIGVVNSGIYCVERRYLQNSISSLTNKNSQMEIYLTDIVAFGYNNQKKLSAVISENQKEMFGVNTHEDLLKAESYMKTKLKNVDIPIMQ